jgi:hypothetical protein
LFAFCMFCVHDCSLTPGRRRRWRWSGGGAPSHSFAPAAASQPLQIWVSRTRCPLFAVVLVRDLQRSDSNLWSTMWQLDFVKCKRSSGKFWKVMWLCSEQPRWLAPVFSVCVGSRRSDVSRSSQH